MVYRKGILAKMKRNNTKKKAPIGQQHNGGMFSKQRHMYQRNTKWHID